MGDAAISEAYSDQYEETEVTEMEGTEESVDTNKFENDDRKLFVGGLTWETTVEQLKSYFEKYGTVKDASIKVDGAGSSRGFGFVLFEAAESVNNVLSEESHSLNNKKIEPKKAEARERVKKIFCGGFGPDINEEELRTHFGQFGEIEKIEIPMKDQEKKLHKGFCFITFTDAAACDAATAKGMQKQELGGKSCDVKKAVPQVNGWTHPGRGGPMRGRGMPMRGRGGPFFGFPPFPSPYGYPMGYPPMGYPPYGGFPPRGGGKMARGARGRGRGRPY